MTPQRRVGPRHRAPDGALPYWDNGRDYEYREEAAEDLLARPVTAAQLAGVRSLSWHTSSAATPLIWRYWDGESADFDVMSLEGIAGALPNLTVLRLELSRSRTSPR
ncbi:DUF6892 domain-containing protein [Streptomyces sp. NPDC058195]|uniref:DUF6892 domain-containing protein n=1 Tax=Streptomyces sp. NPDC058195 TaxID=3346375 RepID=UPI0036EB4A6E